MPSLLLPENLSCLPETVLNASRGTVLLPPDVMLPFACDTDSLSGLEQTRISVL